MDEKPKTTAYLGLSVFSLLVCLFMIIKYPNARLGVYFATMVFAIPTITNGLKMLYINGTMKKMASDVPTPKFAKKESHADVNKLTGTFTRVGLVVVLGYLLLSFNWAKKEYVEEFDFGDGFEDIEEIVPPPTVQPPPPPPPPPPPEIEVVEDEEEVEPPPPIEPEEDPEDEPPPPPPPPKKDKPKKEKPKEPKIFVRAEKNPRFPGCFDISDEKAAQKCTQKNVLSWIKKNVDYPEIAQQSGMEDKVMVRFAVMEDGSIAQVQILKSKYDILKKSVLEGLKKMPKWQAGEQRGNKVPVWFTVPIHFQMSR